MKRFQSPIIEAEQWNGKDGHLGVRRNNSPDTRICESCGGPYNECGQFANLIVCKGDYITNTGRPLPRLYFESTYNLLR